MAEQDDAAQERGAGPADAFVAAAPDALRALLENRFVRSHAPAWLRVDGAGQIVSTGGELARHGLADAAPGTPAVDAADVLFGLLPADAPLELPDVHTLPGRYADVLVHPDPDGTTIVWLDVTERARQRQQLQQRRYDLDLLSRELERSERFIRQTFGRYLSGEVVEQILETPDGLALAGEERRVTLLMNDIRGFTALCETLPPEDVVGLLNRFHGAMADVILRYQGTIDEIIGDALLVIFGAPISREDDASRAVACAIEMMQALAALNVEFREDGLPELEMGIALHSGAAVVGNIGSAQRLKYGVVGRAVNLTGRIEGHTVGGQILASAATVAEAETETGGVATRASFTIHPKGVSDPITVHDVTGIGAPFGLRLDDEHAAERMLPNPLPCRVERYSGKQALGDPFEGQVLSISARGACIASPVSLDGTDSLRLTLSAAGGAAPPEPLHADVTSGGPDPGTWRLRFASLPTPVARFLHDLAAAADEDPPGAGP